MKVTKSEIVKSIIEKKINDKPVLIHASLRSFGKLEKGAKTIADAFLESNCTIVVPAFSYDFEISCPDIDIVPKRNAYKKPGNEKVNDKIFTVRSKEIHPSMGAFPKYVLSLTDSVRGYHPLNSFCAVGPNSGKYIKKQTPTEVYAPLKEMIRDDAFLILMGVDFTKATAIHLAEELSGRNLFIRWANNRDGNPMEVRVGSCSDGFYKIEPYLKDLEKNIFLGKSKWRIFNLKEFVNKVKDVILENDEVTRCGVPGCVRCDDIIKGGPY